MALALVLAAGCAVRTPQPRGSAVAAGSVQGRVLYALDGHGDGAVLELDAATGLPRRQVAPAQQHGYLAVSVARLDRQTLLVAYGRQPRFRSNVVGGDPEPGSCGGEVDRVALRGGQLTTLWSLPADTVLQQAEPSPDGQRVALRVSPCVPFYSNEHIAVTDLHGRLLSSIGAAAGRCHVLWPVSWTANGTRLLFVYAPPAAGAPYTGPDGTCSPPGRAVVTTVVAARSRADLSVPGWYAPAGCEITAAAATPADGVFVVQGCGPGGALNGPIDLIQLDPAGTVARSWRLDTCGDGTDLAVARDGRPAISGYFYCSGFPDTPRTRLFVVQDNNLSAVRTVTGGTLAFASLAW